MAIIKPRKYTIRTRHKALTQRADKKPIIYAKKKQTRYEKKKQTRYAEKKHTRYAEKKSNSSNKLVQFSKPKHLASASIVLQLNETCVSHSIARSLTRTFLLLAIIDGTMSDILYTAIYCLCVTISGSCEKARADVFDSVIEWFYDMNTKNDGFNTLFTIKYSDLKCKFYRKTCPTIDNGAIVILQPLIDNVSAKNTFVNNLKIILDNKILVVLTEEYMGNPDGDNFPTKIISGWLKKRLQPTIAATCNAHSMVLQSWGVGNNCNKVCIKDTQNEDINNKCFNNLNEMCDVRKNPLFILKCADFDEDKLNSVSNVFYDYVITIRNKLYKTTNSSNTMDVESNNNPDAMDLESTKNPDAMDVDSLNTSNAMDLEH
jgi:hypothetical protein